MGAALLKLVTAIYVVIDHGNSNFTIRRYLIPAWDETVEKISHKVALNFSECLVKQNINIRAPYGTH
jgi:hypothetical protein